MPPRTLGPKSWCESVPLGGAGCHVVRTLRQPCGEALVTGNGTLKVGPQPQSRCQRMLLQQTAEVPSYESP